MAALAFRARGLEVEGVGGRPAAPEIAWVRFSELGHSRRGPAIDATWWERWTLDAERRRVREIALEGVTRFAWRSGSAPQRPRQPARLDAGVVSRGVQRPAGRAVV